ncbi:hypothetical protein BGZ68_008180 [Mortierella alpina]|nr:hypothetical protein BGZ68_008180 [Mortierella alpina]
MSASGREVDATHSKPSTAVVVVAAASTLARNGTAGFQTREPLPFKFPASSSPGAEHDATISEMINDNSSWADIEAVAGPEVFDRYYTMLDPDLEAFWDKEAMIRLNKVVWACIQSNKTGDPSSSSDLNLAAAATTTKATTGATTTTDPVVLVDGLPWDKIGESMGSNATVCRHIWSTFGDGRPLSEQERVLLAMEVKRKRRRIQLEKQERERIAREKEQAKVRAERQERERVAKEKELARIKAEKQEQERVAKEKEQARFKAEKQEQERIAKEKEQARIKAEKQEQELAKEKEQARIRAEEQEEARIIKAEAEEKARLAAEQAQMERGRDALDKKATDMGPPPEETAQTLAARKGAKRLASSAAVVVELATKNVVFNNGETGWSQYESDITTRHQRTRLQAQFTKIQHSKTLLEQARKARRQADEDRQQKVSALLSRQAACRSEYNKRNENENIPVPHQHAGNDDKDPGSSRKHDLVESDNDTPNGGMTTATGLTCSPTLYDTQPFNRSCKRPRPKSRPIFVSRFKEVLQQAEQQAQHQRRLDLQQKKKTQPYPSTVAFVQYVYVSGVGLVRQPVRDSAQTTVDLSDAQERKHAMGPPDSANAGPNPYYDILTWSSEDIVGVWNCWVQYGDKWDYISKTVLSGRHSPQECRAFVMGAGFV